MRERLKFIFSQAWDFLRPLIVVLLTEGGLYFMQIANDAVQYAQSQGGTGAEKKDIAVQYFKDSFYGSGLEVGTSIMNSLIEAAVLRMKANVE